MAQCRGTNEEIKVTDQLARGPKTAALLAEHLAGFLVDTDDTHPGKKIAECLFIALRIPRGVYAFVELGERDD
jgi:hypothetical protein